MDTQISVSTPDHFRRFQVALAVTLAALLVVLGIRLVLSGPIDPVLIQASSGGALLLTAVTAAYLTGLQPVLARPSGRTIGTAMAIGLLASVAGAWLTTVSSNLLSQWLGPLSVTAATSADNFTLLLILGILLPAGQSALFWVYLQGSANGLGRRRAALTTALLFAGGILFTSSTGISAVIGILPLALGTASLVYQRSSAWIGMMTTISHGLASLLLPPYLLDLLGLNALSFNWVGATLLSCFGIFFVLQVNRSLGSHPAESRQQKRRIHLLRQPLLWLYGGLVMAITALELLLRSRT